MSNPTSVIPLESNPEIFTEFAHKLGLSPLLSFYDIYSITEQELLQLVPRPIYAIILLFPITKNFEDERLNQDKTLTPYTGELDQPKWFPQLVRNSCGFYALLHVLSNISTNFILSNSLMDNFHADLVQDKNQDKVKLVENLIFNSNNMYEQYSNLGQTELPLLEDSVDLHFIAFVNHQGKIYELDGRRQSYVELGPVTSEVQDMLDEDIIKQKILHYVDLADDENKLNFSMMGLGPSYD